MSQVAYQAGAVSREEYFYCPLGGILVHCRSTPKIVDVSGEWHGESQGGQAREPNRAA